MRIVVLGSGSDGNAVLVLSGATALLLDCGLSARQTKLRMESAGLGTEDLSGIVISHGHGDHIKGLKVLGPSLSCPVYATSEAMSHAKLNGNISSWVPMEKEGEFRVGSFLCRPFSLPHDVVNVGFRVEWEGKSMAMATDLGRATTLVRTAMSDCNVVLLEYNHDVDLLRDSPYPPQLRQRIAGAHGHLNNDQAARLAQEVITGRTQELVLMHLSRKNNTPPLALNAARKALGTMGPALRVATQKEMVEVEI